MERDMMHPGRTPAPTASWALVAGVAVVALLSAVYVAVAPAGAQTDLAERTFDEFAATDPEVAGLFSMQLVLVGVIATAFAALALIVAAFPYRAGQRWAWFALWLVPVAFGLVTVRMLIDGYAVGFYYLALTILASIGLVLPGTRYVRAGGPAGSAD